MLYVLIIHIQILLFKWIVYFNMKSLHSSEKCADERFISFNGSCFAVNFMNTTYFEAQRLCHQKDAELTSIHNRRENIFLTEVSVNLKSSINYGINNVFCICKWVKVLLLKVKKDLKTYYCLVFKIFFIWDNTYMI